jgi:predicted amidophosphoribosyltransferase
MPAHWLRQLADGLVHLVYPGSCLVCETELAPGNRPICTKCRDELTHDPHPNCPRCSSTVGPFANTAQGCPLCRGKTFSFTRVVRLGAFDGLLRAVIIRM